MKMWSAGLLTLMLLTACEGPVGPQGPQGERGPQGIPGEPAEIIWDRVLLDGFGEGVIVFSGAQVETSVVNCYISDSSAGPWIKVAFTGTGPTCGAGNSGSSLRVAMIEGVPGWWFMATAAVEP